MTMTGRKKRPPGPTYRITAQWVERLVERIRELGMSEAEFARRAGVHKSTISHLKAGRQSSSAAAEKMARLAGLSLPVPQIGDDELLEWLELARTLKSASPSRWREVYHLVQRSVDLELAWRQGEASGEDEETGADASTRAGTGASSRGRQDDDETD